MNSVDDVCDSFLAGVSVIFLILFSFRMVELP